MRKPQAHDALGMVSGCGAVREKSKAEPPNGITEEVETPEGSEILGGLEESMPNSPSEDFGVLIQLKQKFEEIPLIKYLNEVPERFPLVVMLISFSIIAVWDHQRGLILWRNYATTGVFGVLLLVAVFWSGRMMIPPLALWLGYFAFILHFGGGSLGAADKGLGPFCWGDMQPGQGLCADGINGMYHVHPLWDRLTHGVGGVALSYGFAVSFKRLSTHFSANLSRPMIFWLAFGVSMSGMAVFEVYEFFGRMFFLTTDQGGYVNTAGDLISDLVGSTAGAYLGITMDKWQVLWEGSSQRPLPIIVQLTQSFIIPMTTCAFIAIADLLIFGGMVMGRDYDSLGMFLTAATTASMCVLLLQYIRLRLFAKPSIG